MTQQEIITFIESQTDLWEKVSALNVKLKNGVIEEVYPLSACMVILEKALGVCVGGGGEGYQTRRPGRLSMTSHPKFNVQSSPSVAKR